MEMHNRFFKMPESKVLISIGSQGVELHVKLTQVLH